MDETEQPTYKQCAYCKESKPLSAFLRRTGRRSGPGARRGACRDCRISRGKAAAPAAAAAEPDKKALRRKAPSRSEKSPLQASPINASNDASLLKPTRQGTIWMRGRTDKGRRWHQEIELELAKTLVKERAAVLVNRHTIRRLYSNRDFRQYILGRDNHTCYFCGQYGETIDHMLPRAKGGHTTPDNCVCACNECNQSKADQDIEAFMKNE
jgi:hypothetical protein